MYNPLKINVHKIQSMCTKNIITPTKYNTIKNIKSTTIKLESKMEGAKNDIKRNKIKSQRTRAVL